VCVSDDVHYFQLLKISPALFLVKDRIFSLVSMSPVDCKL